MLSKTIHSLRTLTLLLAGSVLTAMLFAPAAMAQEEEKDVTRIEVKDGKVYVNGEVVKELENKNARIYFSKDGEGANAFAFFSRDGNTLKGFFSDDEDEDHLFGRFNYRSPRMLEFRSEDGNFSVRDRFTDARRNFEKVLELSPLQERLELIGEDGHLFTSGSREIMKLEMKSRELARKIRQSDDTDRADLEAELDELLENIFDLKLETQQKHLDKMSTELSKLRERIQERGDAKEDVIRRRKRELLGERDAFDW